MTDNVTEINLDNIDSKSVFIEKTNTEGISNNESASLESQIDDLELLVDPNKSLQNSPVQSKETTPTFSNDITSINLADIKVGQENLLDTSKSDTGIDFTMNVEREPMRGVSNSFSKSSFIPRSKPSYSSEDLIEKQELLFKLKRFESRGIPLSNHFSSSSKLEDMREEYSRIKKQRDLENSIKFQRKTMMALASGVEFMNSKFDPFDVKLDGWSESLHENLSDYDDVFEELHEKYKTRAKIAPELKLLMMLGGSAAMFHMTNSFFKSSMPSMDDVLKQNPDLARQFASAAVSSATQNNPGLGNVMGDMINESMNSRTSNNVEQSNSNQMTGPDDQDVERILNQIREFKNEPATDKNIETTMLNTPMNIEQPVSLNPVSSNALPQGGVNTKNIVQTEEVVKRKRGRPPKSKNVVKPDTTSFGMSL